MRIARAPVYRSSQFDTGYSTGEEDVDEDNPCHICTSTRLDLGMDISNL